jgi:DNA polymerase III subunit epsilon
MTQRKVSGGNAWRLFLLKGEVRREAKWKREVFFMFDRDTTVFDLETTGLNPRTDRIVEIAALRIRNGLVVETFQVLIDPEIRIPAKATEITGLTDDDVRGCPTIAEVLPDFMKLAGDSVLVAHNALFDLSFLDVNLRRHLGRGVENHFIDTRALCIDQFPYQSHRLDVMCKKLGIELNGAHRALNDVTATWELLQKLAANTPNPEAYLDMAYYFKKYGVPEWLPSYAKAHAV